MQIVDSYAPAPVGIGHGQAVQLRVFRFMGHISSILSGLPLPPNLATQIPSLSGFDASGDRADALQSADRPVAAMAAQFMPGGTGKLHCHRRVQFLHSLTGVLTVVTESGSWTVSPQHGLLIPAGVMHQSQCWGTIELRTLYIEPDAIVGLSGDCRLIKVSPLVRALINEAVTFPVEYETDGREGRIMDLILSEIRRTQPVPLNVPMPKDKRLARICAAILQDPGNNQDLEHWSQLGGLGRRTLTRLFRRETGMSFCEWRQQVRLMEALNRLTMREPVTNVALDLGYDSPSAFSAMFRRLMGVSPRDYLRWSEAESAEL
jgi:AraC-like DNA-binding protein/mannose-6-phosphate isomerase-like protein (cupin superfamily)